MWRLAESFEHAHCGRQPLALSPRLFEADEIDRFLEGFTLKGDL